VAEAEFDEQDGGVPVGDAGVRRDVDAPFGEGGVEPGARGGVLGQPDVADAREVPRFDSAPGGERVVHVDGEHPGQVDHRALLDSAHGSADGDPRQVQVVCRERVEATAAGVLRLEFQADLGMPVPELDDRRRHEVTDGRGAGGDAYRATVAMDEVREASQCGVEAGDAVGRGCLQEPAGPGGHDAARLPLHQVGPDLPLEPSHMLADGGLGAGQFPGDGAEAAGAAYGDEDAQIIESHQGAKVFLGLLQANPRIDWGVGTREDLRGSRAATWTA
jgi:hypothetical protein